MQKEWGDMTKVLDPRRCRLCGVVFTPNRDWQKFCHPDHQKEFWRNSNPQKNIAELHSRLERIEKHLGIQ